MGDEADALVARYSDPDMGGLGDPYRGLGGQDWGTGPATPKPAPANSRNLAEKLQQRGMALLEKNDHGQCPAARRRKYMPADRKYPEMVECGCKQLYTEGVPVGADTPSPEGMPDRARLLLRNAGHDPRGCTGPAQFLPSENGGLPRARCGCGHTATQADSLVNPTVAVPEPSISVPLSPANTRRTYHPDDPIASVLALIDPTRIYTPEEVERHILDCNARLERGALFERSAIESEGEAEAAWKRAFDLAVLGSEQKAADLRKADAMVQTAELHRDYLQAKMVREAIKSTMHNLRGVLSGYQSVGRSVGATYGASHTGRT